MVIGEEIGAVQAVQDARECGACVPGMLPAEQVALAERTHQQFLRALGEKLSQYLGTPVAATPAGIEQAPLAGFLSGDDCGCLISLDLDPTGLQAFVALPAGLVFRTVGLLIGAPQDAAAPARETLTDIELHILHEFFDTLIRALRESWSISAVNFRLASIAASPESRQTDAPAGTMVVLNSVLKVGEADESFRVALPALLVRLAALEASRTAADPLAAAEGSDVLAALRTARLELEAVLEGSTLRMSDILAMEPGRILMLGHPAGSLFDCLVNGKLKFRGELIHVGEHQALLIDSLVSHGAARPQ